MRQHVQSAPILIKYTLNKYYHLNLTANIPAYSSNKKTPKSKRMGAPIISTYEQISRLRWHRNMFLKHNLGAQKKNHTSECFLEPFIKDCRIIGQFVKRQPLSSGYVVFTVQKHLLLSHWVITVYIPKTCRRYIGYMVLSDFMHLDMVHLHAVYPLILDLLYSASIPTLFSDYKAFTEYLSKIQMIRL